VSCRYVEVGPPGPAGNELRVFIRSNRWSAVIAREGDLLTVSSLGLVGGGMVSSAGQPRTPARVATAINAADARASRTLSCAGGAPSVTEVDLISVLGGRRVFVPSVLLGLRRGPLAPGASDEGDGSSEIEVTLGSSGLISIPAVVIRSGPGDDHFELGRAQGTQGLNLNADEPQPDVDIRVSGIFSFYAISSGAGDDEVGATGRGFDRPPGFAFMFALLGRGDDLLHSGPSLSFVVGGRGNDRMLGGSSPNFLRGGPGRDILRGRRNRDQLVGGPQRDELRAGPGRDHVHSADGRHDRVQCGHGRDSLVADRRDGRRGCELVKRRVRRP
jgi:hypothetical protein